MKTLGNDLIYIGF